MPARKQSTIEGFLFQGIINGEDNFIFLPADGFEKSGYFFSKIQEFCAWVHSFGEEKRIRLVLNTVPSDAVQLAGHEVQKPRRLTDVELSDYARAVMEMKK